MLLLKHLPMNNSDASLNFGFRDCSSLTLVVLISPSFPQSFVAVIMDKIFPQAPKHISETDETSTHDPSLIYSYAKPTIGVGFRELFNNRVTRVLRRLRDRLSSSTKKFKIHQRIADWSRVRHVRVSAATSIRSFNYNFSVVSNFLKENKLILEYYNLYYKEK